MTEPCADNCHCDRNLRCQQRGQHQTPMLLATSPSSASSTARRQATSSNRRIANSLIAGSVAGMASTIACHPFDVLRVKLQSAAAVQHGVGGKHMSLSTAVRTTMSNGGFAALYTGLSLPLAAQAIYKATIFSVNAAARDAIRSWKVGDGHSDRAIQLTQWDNFLCGSVAGGINGALFVTPVEYVRNQLIQHQSTHGTSSGSHRSAKRPAMHVMDVIRMTIRTDGVLGLWRGTMSTVARDSVGCGCFFVAISVSQRYFVQRRQQQQQHHASGTSANDTMRDNSDCDKQKYEAKPSLPILLTSGAFAGVSFWIWALPVDTIKTWIQAGSFPNMTSVARHLQHLGWRDAIPTIFRGWEVAYSRGVPSAAVTVTVYSLVHQELERISSS